jgi:hypothetical protein
MGTSMAGEEQAGQIAQLLQTGGTEPGDGIAWRAGVDAVLARRRCPAERGDEVRHSVDDQQMALAGEQREMAAGIWVAWYLPMAVGTGSASASSPGLPSPATFRRPRPGQRARRCTK